MSNPRHSLNKRPLTWPVLLSTVAGTLAWYVPKDYMKPGAGQWMVRLGGVGTGLSWYLYDSSRLTVERVQEEPKQQTQLSRWQGVALLVVLLALVGASFWMSMKMEQAVLRWLVRRGVKRPNVVWGVLSAVVVTLTVVTDENYDPHLPGGILSE